MDSEWRESTWGEEISLEYGKAIRGYQETSGTFRVFGSNGPVGWTDHALADGPGVVLGRKGAYRGVRYSRDPFWVIDTAYFVVPKTLLDMRWLYYAIKHYKLGEIDDGSPIPSTTRAAVYVQDLTVPPLEEQRAIAEILGVIDDRIDNLRQSSATLEAIAQALFKSWFVDFDPVRAKAEGREPEGMDAATAALFPSEFKDSELGPIPKDWTIAPFATQFEFTMGQSPPGTTYNTGGIGVSFFQGCTDFGEVFPAERVYCSQPTRFAQVGDVLMSVRAPVGALNIAATDCSIGRGLCAIRHKLGSTGLTLQFVKACMSRIENAAGEGALFNSLSKQQLAQLPVLVADAAIVEAMASLLWPLSDRRILLAKQAESLTNLRDTLLPRLISGKLRLPDAKVFAEEAVT